jgi:hypothetical protein
MGLDLRSSMPIGSFLIASGREGCHWLIQKWLIRGGWSEEEKKGGGG